MHTVCLVIKILYVMSPSVVLIIKYKDMSAIYRYRCEHAYRQLPESHICLLVYQCHFLKMWTICMLTSVTTGGAHILFSLLQMETVTKIMILYTVSPSVVLISIRWEPLEYVRD